MDPIIDLAKQYRLEVIEDSAECMFATYNGRSVGSIWTVGCFSTYVAHFLVTGVGGLVTTDDSELAINMRSLMNHGRDGIYISASDDEGLSVEKLKEVVSKRFSFIHVGHSFRCTEMEAAIGVGQLERSKQIISRRKEIAETFNKELSKFSERVQLPDCPENRTHTFMMYGLLMKNEKKHDIVNFLENLNIETRDLLPIINQPIYKRLYGKLDKKYPVAKKINESGFYIGCHSYMTDSEVNYIIDVINNFMS